MNGTKSNDATVIARGRSKVTRKSRESRGEGPSGLVLWLRRRTSLGFGLLGMLIVLAIWQFLTAVGVVDPLIASSPTRVISALTELIRSGDIWSPTLTTASEVGRGMLVAIVLSIPLGLILGRVRSLRDMAEPLINVLNSVPYVMFLPIIIFWFGIGENSRILIVIWAATMPLLINTSAGVQNVDRDYLRVARVFCAGRIRFYSSVLLPASLPYILTGLRLAVARGLVAAIVGEFFLSGGGLGYFVQTSTSNFDMDNAMAGIVVMAAGAIGLTRLIGIVEDRFSSWSKSEIRL